MATRRHDILPVMTEPNWTEDDNRMSYVVDTLTEVIEMSDPDSRKARLLRAARELTLMAATAE